MGQPAEITAGAFGDVLVSYAPQHAVVSQSAARYLGRPASGVPTAMVRAILVAGFEGMAVGGRRIRQVCVGIGTAFIEGRLDDNIKKSGHAHGQNPSMDSII